MNQRPTHFFYKNQISETKPSKKITRGIFLFVKKLSLFPVRFIKFAKEKPLLAIVALIVVGGGLFVFINGFDKKDSGVKSAVLEKIDIGRSFVFKVKSSDGREGQVVMTVESAEKTNVVKLKGEPVHPKEGRMFLTLNLDLDNQASQNVKFFSADHIRYLDPSGKKHAPGFYNSDVTIFAFAAIKDRVAFVIDEEEKDIMIEIGELVGNKQSINLQFTK